MNTEKYSILAYKEKYGDQVCSYHLIRKNIALLQTETMGAGQVFILDTKKNKDLCANFVGSKKGPKFKAEKK
jgi:hypothetical protein